jgi:hypothetical protein
MMNYVPPCTEEEFNQAVLNMNSEMWAQRLKDWDHGAHQLTPLGQDALQDVFDNAVAMGLMIKRELGCGLAPLYDAAPLAYKG